MSMDWIENTVYRVGASAFANFVGEELNIDNIIVGENYFGNSKYVKTLQQSAYLFAAQELGEVVLDKVTGTQAPSMASMMSMSMLESFIGSTLAYFIMKETNVNNVIRDKFGRNQLSRVLAEASIYELAGQIASTVAPLFMAKLQGL